MTCGISVPWLGTWARAVTGPYSNHLATRELPGRELLETDTKTGLNVLRFSYRKQRWKEIERETQKAVSAFIQTVPVWPQRRKVGRAVESESASRCWAIKGQLSKAEGSPWTRADHQRNPMPLSNQPTLTSLLCLAAGWEQPQESHVNGLMDFRTYQQGSGSSDTPSRLWSWPPWPTSSALALHDICAPW